MEIPLNPLFANGSVETGIVASRFDLRTLQATTVKNNVRSTIFAVLSTIAGSLLAHDASAQAVHPVELATGARFNCARMSDGTVRCWGQNQYGALGDAGRDPRRLAPVTPVAGVAGATGLVTGGQHACVLDPRGVVTCWGDGMQGQVGNGQAGEGARRLIPTPVLAGASRLFAGPTSTCALVVGGAVYCWGGLPVRLLPGADGPRVRPSPVTGLSRVSQLALGDAHGCALLADGSVRCWGANEMGQLGVRASAPVSPTPIPVRGLSGVRFIAAGGRNTCAVVGDGTVRCWGLNNLGVLGPGANQRCEDVREVPPLPAPCRVTPTPVPGVTNARSVAVGGSHACAVLNDNTVRCWGANAGGQLGAGMASDSAPPVPPAGLVGVAAVTIGAEHTCAMLLTGAIVCWGRNSSGELGDGSTNNRPVAGPVRF